MDAHLATIHASVGALTFRGVPWRHQVELLQKVARQHHCEIEPIIDCELDLKDSEPGNETAEKECQGIEGEGLELEEEHVADQEVWRYVQELVKLGSKGKERHQFVLELLARGVKQVSTLPVDQPKGKEGRHKRIGERFKRNHKRIRTSS